MNIEQQIEFIVEKIAKSDKSNPPKTKAQIQQIISNIQNDFKNSNYNFSKLQQLILNQNGKKRLVKQYTASYSTENVLCHVIKNILDRSFKIKYPNRNKIAHELFCILPAVIKMSNFTIAKFDFKDYFNSVSSIYVFEKIIKTRVQNRVDADLINAFVQQTKFAYAGLCTSNTIAEIIANYFDQAVKEKLQQYGLIYYERYIDDGILILNDVLSESQLRSILNSSLKETFNSPLNNVLKCHTKFNDGKFQYLSSKSDANNQQLNFLGYEFFFNSKVKKSVKTFQVKYGITEEKRKKYTNRVDKLIEEYKTGAPGQNGIELLRHRILAFTCREVYQVKNGYSNVWKVKGFISNYGELRYLLDTDLLEENTKTFLLEVVLNAFKKANLKPYFLNGQIKEDGYNLFNNMMKNKTILLVDHIGYNYESLVRLCKAIGISNIGSGGKKLSYGELVREYLIKVKVGY